ncbi:MULTISPECIES: hypothetical protein [Dethiosulfovibrio]|uniref:Uncharacterized protein n=2 Tax=Dethiosulfovibrio TaxID=47054 RepID=A0ABS9EPF8_9BACT|nr:MULTISPECIES: hypothetical protein [Dethiosulfovibrio]MCF4114718.1 hypothetical protein [Dethiosulfovibrio russensis]MCF4143077.1 hypothetical protein [Dethiosulfovibrio marinus]MCF4145223.1 hypothetical protein [Dethiosulfovibrio acidaminovorans]
MKKLFTLLVLTILLFCTTKACAAFLPFGPIGYEQAEKIAKEASSKDPVAGIYELTKGIYYRGRFLVLPNNLKERPEAKYLGIIVRTQNPYEPLGAVKFWLTEKKPPTTFLAEYYDFSAIATTKAQDKVTHITPRRITVHLMGPVNYPPNQFMKLYP